MEKFTQLTGVAAPLPMHNLDTDKIFPAMYLKTIKRTGLVEMAVPGNPVSARRLGKPGFRPEPGPVPQCQDPDRRARISAAARAASMRPGRLLDFGIRCVIAPSFADIFYNNCFKNGMLPIALPQEIVDELMEDAKKGANAVLTVDLETQTITAPGRRKGAVRASTRSASIACLNGLDDIGLTEQKGAEIAGYEKRRGRPGRGSSA